MFVHQQKQYEKHRINWKLRSHPRAVMTLALTPGWPCHLHCRELFSRVEPADLGHSFSCRTLGVTQLFSHVLLCSILFSSDLFYSIPFPVLTMSQIIMWIFVWNASGLWKTYDTKVTTGNRTSFYFSDSVLEPVLTSVITMCMYSPEKDNAFFSLALKSIPCRLAKEINRAKVFKRKGLPGN